MKDKLATDTVARPEDCPLIKSLLRLVNRTHPDVRQHCRVSTRAHHQPHLYCGSWLEYFMKITVPVGNKMVSNSTDRTVRQ